MIDKACQDDYGDINQSRNCGGRPYALAAILVPVDHDRAIRIDRSKHYPSHDHYRAVEQG